MNRSKSGPYEFKLMMFYHVSMILALIVQLNNAKYLFTYTLIVGVVFLVLSVRHKRKVGWVWKGIGVLNVLKVIFIVVSTYLFVVFLSYTTLNPRVVSMESSFTEIISLEEVFKASLSTVLENILNSKVLAVFFTVIGISTYNLLAALNLVTEEESRIIEN